MSSLESVEAQKIVPLVIPSSRVREFETWNQ